MFSAGTAAALAGSTGLQAPPARCWMKITARVENGALLLTAQPCEQ